MSDLIDFLQARLAEDEATARAVEDGSAPWDGQWVADGPNALRTVNGHVLAYGHRTTDGDLPMPLKAGLANHWARHDPARVLADVEAKREVLRLAARAHDYHETFMNGFASAMEGALRLFALAYADHPEYRQEWAA
jgi:hypothetical protein